MKWKTKENKTKQEKTTNIEKKLNTCVSFVLSLCLRNLSFQNLCLCFRTHIVFVFFVCVCVCFVVDKYMWVCIFFCICRTYLSKIFSVLYLLFFMLVIPNFLFVFFFFLFLCLEMTHDNFLLFFINYETLFCWLCVSNYQNDTYIFLSF